jgi:hypothetical protein
VECRYAAALLAAGSMNAVTSYTRAVLSCLAMLFTCLLSACYLPRQTAFERSVHRQIQVNMPVALAQENLRRLKLTCQRHGVELDCSRSLDGLLLSCIQRVVLMPSEPEALVTNIDIRKIVCLGGFG